MLDPLFALLMLMICQVNQRGLSDRPQQFVCRHQERISLWPQYPPKAHISRQPSLGHPMNGGAMHPPVHPLVAEVGRQIPGAPGSPRAPQPRSFGSWRKYNGSDVDGVLLSSGLSRGTRSCADVLSCLSSDLFRPGWVHGVCLA